MANTFHYYRGGDCVYTFSLSNLLEQMGHKVVHFAMKHPLNLPSQYSEFFVPEIDFPKELAHNGLRSGIRVLSRFIYSNIAKRKLSQLLDKYPVHIAHIQNIHGCITPSIFEVLKARHIPIVWTLHDYKILCPNITFFSKGKICEACGGNRFYNVVLRKCRKDSYLASLLVILEACIHRLLGLLKLIDFFIAPSQFLRNKLIEYGFPSDKIVHIPNFIDIKDVIISHRNNENEYVLYVGRLSSEKGLTTLIRAISLCDSVGLFIAGDGPLGPELRKMAEDIAPSKIKFLGYVDRDKIQELIVGASFVVLPSEWYENFPYSILESFAFGKPAIGSRIGGIPELIRDEETGLLFEPGNADDLAEKIQWMIDHPKQRQEMGQRARELVEKECNPELHYERLMAVYRMALKKHGR